MKQSAIKNRIAVVVRGMGVYCPLGTNCAELEKALLDERDSIKTVTTFDASCFLSDQASAFGADIETDLPDADAEWMDRATLLTVNAYNEAVADAGIDLKHIAPDRIAVCFGSSHAGLVRTEEVAKDVINDSIDTIDRKVISATLVSHSTAIIKRLSGAEGRILTISSACASSNSAVGVGADMIARGEADVVIAGGVDTISVSVMAGFNALRALTPQKTAPFGQDIGLSLGEGAGIMILARDDLDGNAGHHHGQILNYGLSGDAHHATAPDKNGAGAAEAVIAALDAAAVEPTEIGYINAHGTGTEANDGAESRAIARLFGDSVPISSTKSYYGHTLGASGIIETITSILTLKHGKAPASLRLQNLREDVEPLNFAKSDTSVNPNTILLINNFGFGGNNSSLLIQIGEDARQRALPDIATDALVITGMGVCSGAGFGSDAFHEALTQEKRIDTSCGASGVAVAQIGALRFETPDLKHFSRASPATKYALKALKEALEDDADAFAENQRAGLVGGAVFGAQKPTEKFMESVFQGDPALANAHYFPMMVMNATSGVASLAFQIKGYNTTICGSAAALAYAADLAAENRQDRVAVVAGDEFTERLECLYHRAGIVALEGKKSGERAVALGEFGAALTIERHALATQRGAPILAHLKGWATRQDPIDLSVKKSGAGLIRAQQTALAMASLTAADINHIVLLNSGLAPVKSAVKHALKAVFGDKIPPATHPTEVFGYAPSAAPLMMVLAGLSIGKGKVMATGCDAMGESFSFIVESVAS